MSGANRLTKGKIRGLLYVNVPDYGRIKVKISGTWSGRRTRSRDRGADPALTRGETILKTVRAAIAGRR